MTASGSGPVGPRTAGPASCRRLVDLVDRALLTPRDAWRLGRRSAHDRIARLRAGGWFIAQSAIGAGLAWFAAGTLLHHVAPFLAPIAALIVLSQSYGQRIRRTLEVVGVAIGVAVGDVFRVVFGVGWWQVTVVVLAAMVVALLLGAGQLMVTQAAAQSGRGPGGRSADHAHRPGGAQPAGHDPTAGRRDLAARAARRCDRQGGSTTWPTPAGRWPNRSRRAVPPAADRYWRCPGGDPGHRVAVRRGRVCAASLDRGRPARGHRTRSR